MKSFNTLQVVALSILLAISSSIARAQPRAPKAIVNKTAEDDKGEVSTILTAQNKNAIFSNAASFSFDVKNTFNKPQSGKISYVVTDQFNKKLLADSVKVKISKQSSNSYNFTIPQLKSGFYKINFMINVSDYDDTTRRVFGIRAEEIRSNHSKPDDFDAFWDNTKKELAKVAPNFKMIEKPELEKDNRKVYMIQMQSLGNLTIRGWLTMPSYTSKYHKFPVLVMLPGYQASNKPLLGHEDDLAFINLDVRGQGLNHDDINMRREDYIVAGLEDKNKYIIKGMIMDCIRCIDFICSRPEFAHDRISVTGGSMGGYLSITTAALDKRIALCAPQNPFLSDIYNMDGGAVEWPINHMKEYVKIRPGLTFKKVMENLQYFDTKNFATKVNCPVVMGIGLLDPFVPPNNSYAVFNNFGGKKKMFIFKDLGHEVGNKYYNYEELWMRDAFGLF